jgi:hypothetical protein
MNCGFGNGATSVMTQGKVKRYRELKKITVDLNDWGIALMVTHEL